jgi:hypothetical protein
VVERASHKHAEPAGPLGGRESEPQARECYYINNSTRAHENVDFSRGVFHSSRRSVHFQILYLATVLDFFVVGTISVLSALDVLQPTTCAVYSEHFIGASRV